MEMNEYTLEIVVRDRLAELRRSAAQAHRARATSAVSGSPRAASGDGLRRLRNLLRLRSGVDSPSTSGA